MPRPTQRTGLLAALATSLSPAPPAAVLAEVHLPQLGSPEVGDRIALAAALADVSHPFGVAALWVLACDGDLAVRQASLAAAQARCAAEPPALCVRLLHLFVADAEVDVAWESRDALLQRDLGAALAGAPRAYKLDLLQRMPVMLAQQRRDAEVILRRLSDEDDPDVQDHAAFLLER